MTRPMTWLAALRDHPERPPVAQRMVLVSLAQRMDWSTGCGFASAAQLADDADCGERTVRSATGWARKSAMLVQTRRGHRITADRVIASEWRLRVPDEAEDPTGNGMPVGSEPTGKWDGPNRQIDWTQPARTAPPSRTSSSRTSSSARGDSAKAPRPPRGSTTSQRVLQAIEAGQRLQAMMDAQAQPAPDREPVDVAAEIAKTRAHLARLNGRGEIRAADAPETRTPVPPAQDAEEQKQRALDDLAAYMRDHPEAAL